MNPKRPENDDPTPLDEYIDAFAMRMRDVPVGSGISAAKAPRRRLRRRAPLLATATGLAAVIVAVVALLGNGAPGQRLDVLGEARAALTPDGSILHLKITTFFGDSGDTKSQMSEQWIADGPPRWRFVQVIPPAGSPNSTGSFADDQGPIEGREEFAYADGKLSTYIAERDTLEVTTGFDDGRLAARPPGVLGLARGGPDVGRSGADPAADLRSALDAGRVTDEGERQVDGRTVRRLISEYRSRDGGPVRRFVYDVDPDTFAPVGGEAQIGLPDEPGFAPIRSRFRVDVYERLPETPAKAKLLTIATTPNTKTTTRTIEQQRERVRRRVKDCITGKNGDGDTRCTAGRRGDKQP